MTGPEGQPQSPRPQPEGLRFTSRHTARIGDKLYNVDTVVEMAKDLEIFDVPTSELENMKYGKYWNDKQGSRICPNDIINLHERTKGNWDSMVEQYPGAAEHIRRIEQSDYTNFPVLLIGPKGKAWLFDGMHRLTKALIDKAPTIKAKTFETLPDSAIIKE